MTETSSTPDQPNGEATTRAKRQRPLRSGNALVPRETIAGTALVFVVAIMSFLACLTLGAVSMVTGSAEKWQSDISREVTIQIKPFDQVEMDVAIREAGRLALETEGVSKVTLLNDAATLRLLEPWLGTGLELGELPIPRLLVVEIEPGTTPNFAALRNRLADTVPGASLDDHRAWVERLTLMALTMVAVGTTIFLLVLAATITTVIFATRGAMAGNRDVVEVLHFVGADAGFISRQFERHFFFLGLKGALAGTFGAISIFLILSLWAGQSVGTPEGDQISVLFGTFQLGLSGYIGMLVVLFAVGLLTALTSRWTVARQANALQQYGARKE